MSNAVVTPLFPTGGRVRAWCVTALARRNTAGSSALNVTTQSALDDISFVDGYNLRLGIESAVLTKIYFKFITPMQDSAYRVFVQPRMNPVSENTLNLNNTNLEKYRLVHVLNTSDSPKTKYGFWIRLGHTSENLWNNNQKLIITDRIDERQSGASNTLRRTLALSVVVL
jgi:hypothetical protein